MGKVIQLHQRGKGGWEGTRRRIHLAILNGTEFKSGAMRGERVAPPVSTGRLPDDWAAVLRDQQPDYVVWSYGTPIAWHHEGGWTVPDERYSNTTTRHQGFARVALALAGPVQTLDDERLR
jgi:hypothetical protein